MGDMSKPEGEVLATLEAMVKEHPLSVSTEEFKSLLSWVRVEFPNVDSQNMFTPSLWEKINLRVYEKTTLRDEAAAELLTASAVTYEVIASKWESETQARDTMGPEKQKGLFQSDEECLLPHAAESVRAFLRSTLGKRMSKPVESPEKQLYRDEEAILTREQNLQKGGLELLQECPSSFGAVPALGVLLQAEEGGETSLAACVPAAESLRGPRGVEGTALSPPGGCGRARPEPERSGTSTGTAAPAPRLPGVGLEPQLSVRVTSAVTQPQPRLQTPPAAPPPGAAAVLLKWNLLCNTAAAEQQQLEKTTAAPQQMDSLNTTQSQESFEHSHANAQFFQPANLLTDTDSGLRDMSIQSPASLEWFQKNSRKAKIKSIVRCITG